GYIEAAEKYFRSPVARATVEQLAAEYEAQDLVGFLLAWDAETATGRPRLTNEFVAEAVRNHPTVFVGFGSVDPHKGQAAVEAVDRIAELGLKGVKLHPSLQAFFPDDESYFPIYARCQAL